MCLDERSPRSANRSGRGLVLGRNVQDDAEPAQRRSGTFGPDRVGQSLAQSWKFAFAAIQKVLGRIAVPKRFTKVGCSEGGDEHQLAGAGPMLFAS